MIEAMLRKSLEPMDRLNQELVARVHPDDWTNPRPSGRYNLVVLGAGPAGLVAAAGAAGLGAKVALVEKGLMGGDCLNVGCVPSKTLLRCARAAHEARRAGRFGVTADGVHVDFSAVMERVRAVRTGIAHHDSAKRYRDELGVDVYLGAGRFTAVDRLEVDGRTLVFSKAVITTGARAVEPPIAGLKESGFLTNENLFNLRVLPRRLAVIGSGPIGCEMAQAFARLGSEVTVIDIGAQVLGREDGDAASVVAKALAADGVRFAMDTKILGVERRGEARVLRLAAKGGESALEVDQVLVGIGRAPNVDGLGLEAAKVGYDPRGVVVDDTLRTTNPRIYAAGDVCLAWKFTHAADFAARIVIQNALFPGKKRRLSSLIMPWCTYTDPEIAHVGLYEREARDKGIAVDTYVKPLAENDRSVAEDDLDGFVKVHTFAGTDRIAGATVVAARAGELIAELCLAMRVGAGLGTVADALLPYPTQSEAVRQVGDLYQRTRLKPWVRAALGAWLKWNR